MKRIAFAAALIVLAGLLVWLTDPAEFSTRSTAYVEIEEYLVDPADRGAAAFAFGDFGALSSETMRTSAAAWKLMTAALALREANGDAGAVSSVDIAALFKKFGFLSPDRIENWPANLPVPELKAPLGLNLGDAAHDVWPIAVTITNTGCAACHSSAVYRADGTPDPSRVWLGTPNGSINLEAYAQSVFAAFRDYAGDADALMAAVGELYPDTGWQEWFTLRYLIRPMIAEEIAARDDRIGRLLPFASGLPGATNGLNALEYRLGLIGEDEVIENSVFNSVPDLGGRVWRRSFLNTETYAPRDQSRAGAIGADDIDAAHLRRMGAIVAYFTVPSMGVSELVAEAHIGDAQDILTWMASDYRPQSFPGPIDREKLPLGSAVYGQHCSACHGTYDDSLEDPALVSFPNWSGDIGTDPKRMELTGKELASAVNAGRFAAHMEARAARGYIAPPLTGLWSSAPYLHNGSVPTLWHLMHPEERPDRFVVGGHALDLDLVGIAGADDGAGGWMPREGYEPWSLSAVIDTSRFGLSNGGHEVGFADLGPEERAALLEYLKLL